MNNPLRYVDPDGMDVNLLDDQAREYLLLTVPTNIRDKVNAVIANGKGNLARGSLDKIKSDDANFAALKEMVNAREITEAATAEKDINGVPFSQETVGEQYESDIQAYMQNNNVSRAEAEKIISRPTKPNELNFYRGETLTPNGEDGVPASPSGNLRAVAANRQGKSASIPLEEAVVAFGHELYGHAYFFRQGNRMWGGHGPVMNAIEDRTRRNYREGGEQKKSKPANLKPKE